MSETSDIRKIGILTGGGDCPGLNAAIRGVVVKAHQHGIRVMGIQRGWWGLLHAEAEELTLDDVQDIHKIGGTILGSSRTNVYGTEEGPERAREGFKKLGIDALIAIGGEDTLGVAAKLTREGMPTIALPKTIDKDLSATDTTIGFNTAITIATDAIDRVHTTMRSHHRIGVVEIMGRHAGWMALMAGMAGGAQAVLIPEVKFDLDEIAQIFIDRKARGMDWGVIAIAEGAQPTDLEGFVTQDDSLDSFGHVKLGGIGKKLAREIEKRTGIESRATVLGHIQRGGSPTVYDRITGTKLGVKAVEMILAGQFGHMAAVRGNDIVPVDVQEAVGRLNTVSPEEYEVARLFFGL
jgi:6-phosphofructokinase 1